MHLWMGMVVWIEGKVCGESVVCYYGKGDKCMFNNISSSSVGEAIKVKMIKYIQLQTILCRVLTSPLILSFCGSCFLLFQF